MQEDPQGGPVAPKVIKKSTTIFSQLQDKYKTQKTRPSTNINSVPCSVTFGPVLKHPNPVLKKTKKCSIKEPIPFPMCVRKF